MTKEFTLNGKCTVSFDPYDAAFCKRIFDLFVELDEMQEEYHRKASEIKGAELFDYGREMDKRMRAGIDGLFGQPVCDVIFGIIGLYLPSDGRPRWANMLLAVIEKTSVHPNRRYKKLFKKYM